LEHLDLFRVSDFEFASFISLHSFYICLSSPVRQHGRDAVGISGINQYVAVEHSLPFGRFFRQDVTGMRMTAFDFSRRGGAKPLVRTPMCF
jgi:hypothetical protein